MTKIRYIAKLKKDGIDAKVITETNDKLRTLHRHLYCCYPSIFTRVQRQMGEQTVRKIKDEKFTWVWLKIFRVAETKENFFKFARVLSTIAVMLMILNIIWLIITMANFAL
jgi:hypothetical protein